MWVPLWAMLGNVWCQGDGNEYAIAVPYGVRQYSRQEEMSFEELSTVPDGVAAVDD